MREDTPAGEPFTPIPPPARPASEMQLMTPSPQRGGMGRPRRTVLALTIGFFGLLLAGGLVWVAVSQLNARRATVPTPSASAAQVIAIKSAADFDPSADGGSNAENPRLAARSIDTDPDSAWLTERYRGEPKLGGLKPGVGLVLDLGSARTVSQVSVGVIGDGTAVELRVPADPDVTAAPMRSASEWTVIANVPEATGTAVLKLGQPTTTRFLLVYLTSLPPETGNYFQGGVTNVEVRG